MSKKKECNVTQWQIDRVNTRRAFIEQAIKLSRGGRFDSYNAYAVHLAAQLTQFELVQEKTQHDASGSEEEFVPPKPVSRQIFFTNKAYRALAEAAYIGKKIQGSSSIKQPKTISEFNAVLVQKDFELSNQKAEIEQLKAEIRLLKQGGHLDAIDSDANAAIEKAIKEKSMVVQAIIKIMKWGEDILDFKDGQILDPGKRGDRAIVVERRLLTHCATTLSKALDGFVINE
ncbi:MAG: hypothetical protein ABW090_17670 [Sedimenticola sp.]